MFRLGCIYVTDIDIVGAVKVIFTGQSSVLSEVHLCGRAVIKHSLCHGGGGVVKISRVIQYIPAVFADGVFIYTACFALSEELCADFVVHFLCCNSTPEDVVCFACGCVVPGIAGVDGCRLIRSTVFKFKEYICLRILCSLGSKLHVEVDAYGSVK